MNAVRVLITDTGIRKRDISHDKAHISTKLTALDDLQRLR